METVLDVLEAMGKASYREVAARMKIEPVEALNMLREQRDLGKCDFGDGGWWLTGVQPPQKAEAKDEPKSGKFIRPHGEEPAPVKPGVVRQLLEQHGAMSTAALAEQVGRNARGMVSVMRSLERAGIVVKNGEGKGVTWSLPDTAKSEQPAESVLTGSHDEVGGMGIEATNKPVVADAAPQNLTDESTSGKEKSAHELLQDIPSFTGIEPDGLLSELQRQVTAAKRRHRAEGLRLEEIDSAVRVLNKPCNRGVVEELLQWQNW